LIAPDAPTTINFPSKGVIPAGWFFLLSLQYSGNNISGATCHVRDNTGAEVQGSPMVVKLLGRTGSNDFPGDPSGTVDEAWLAPIVMGQLLVCSAPEETGGVLTGGSGYLALSCKPGLEPANSWNNSSCTNSGGGTAENSDCAYSFVPNVRNATLIQRFAAPSVGA
jgi:hypothetical protein